MDCETERVAETKRESKKEFDGFILWSCSLSSRYRTQIGLLRGSIWAQPRIGLLMGSIWSQPRIGLLGYVLIRS